MNPSNAHATQITTPVIVQTITWPETKLPKMCTIEQQRARRAAAPQRDEREQRVTDVGALREEEKRQDDRRDRDEQAGQGVEDDAYPIDANPVVSTVTVFDPMLL